MTKTNSSKEEVLAAIITKGAVEALASASPIITDPDIALAAATGNGYALQYVSPDVIGKNESIAFAALNSSGVKALKFLYNPVALPALEKYLHNEISTWRTMGTDWMQNQINDLCSMANSLKKFNVGDVMEVVQKVFKNEKDIISLINNAQTTAFKTSLLEIKEAEKTQFMPPSQSL